MKCRELAAVLSTGLALFLVSTGVQAAQKQTKQSQTVVEAAKKTAEQQKQAPKAKVVWTDDNIAALRGSVAVMGQVAPPATANPQPQASDDADTAADRAEAQGDLDSAKQQLAGLKAELDLLQRTYNLDAAQYYGTPNFAADQQGQKKLDGEKAQIATKQQAVDAAQQKVDALEKQLQSLPPAEPKAAAPQSPQS